MLTQSKPVKSSKLIPPYGDELVNLVVPPEAINDLKAYASHLPFRATVRTLALRFGTARHRWLFTAASVYESRTTISVC